MTVNKFLLKTVEGELIENPIIEGLEVLFKGKNSTVTIAEGAVFRNSKIIMGHDSRVEINKTHPRGILNTVVDMSGQGGQKLLEIDEGFSVESCRFAMANESDLTVRIGKNCLLSSNITFRPTDGHVIFDLDSKQIINRTKLIAVADHVWIGSGVTLLKGASVPKDSIIGTCAVLAKKIDKPNVAIAGNPAKIVKENIGWSREYIENFKSKNYLFDQ